ncbi:MAG: lipocalin family protein [Panacibacter sp.]
MKRFAIFILTCSSMLMVASCKKDAVDPSLPVLKLRPAFVSGKTGQQFFDTLDIEAPNGIKTLVITKGINLIPDNVFGSVTVTPESLGGTSYRYIFSYTYLPEEVDKLVGINFHFEDAKGNAAEKDLTINTEASAVQNIYSHTWKLTSTFWTTDDPPSEAINDCEKDNNWNFNKDSSITVNYGALGCLFDGFNIFDKWYLSEDEKTFTQVFHSVFDPTKITVQEYTVKSISKNKLIFEIALDLSDFGFSDHEIFVYTYEAL